jgi:acetoin utilization deacetylase AcuC-like enzyme
MDEKLTSFYDRCSKIESRYANEAELELSHDLEYINQLKGTKKRKFSELKKMKNNNDIETYDCARLATGCLLSVLDNVCQNQVN